MTTESLDPGLVLLAFAPVFLLTIGAEAWYWARRDLTTTVRYDASGWAISGEAGYAIPVRDGWVANPRHRPSTSPIAPAISPKPTARASAAPTPAA